MFAQIFSNLLQEHKVSAYTVSKETGISNGNLSEYKKGIKTPTADNLNKIADYFGVTTDYLLGRTSSFNAINGGVSGSAVIQGINNGTVTIKNGTERVLTVEEVELLHIMNKLDVKRRHKLLATAFSLEEEIKEK